MRKIAALLMLMPFFLCGCYKTTPVSTNIIESDISIYNVSSKEETIPFASSEDGNWTIKLSYNGHIMSQYDYQFWGYGTYTENSEAASTTTIYKGESLISVNAIKTLPETNCFESLWIVDTTSVKLDNVNASVPYGSRYEISYNGSQYQFCYTNSYTKDVKDGKIGQYNDNITCDLSEEKALGFREKALEILNAKSGIFKDLLYHPYHSNEDGIMIREYTDYTLECDDHQYGKDDVCVELTEQQYQELLDLFEEVRQAADKYNWEKTHGKTSITIVSP